MKYLPLLLACIISAVLMGCFGEVADNGPGDPDSGQALVEPQQPPEAGYFQNLALVEAFKGFAQGNPIMTQNFGADPNVLVWDDRLYVYMTADSLRYSGNTVISHDYSTITSLRVLSTADMVNWTQHPEIKKGEISLPNGNPASWIANLWAPALAAKEIDGQKKIFLYFSNSAGAVGVISADNPLGPWTSPLSNGIVNASTPNTQDVVWIFDPGVLVDDDGRAYLYFGGGTPAGGNQVNGTYPDYDSKHPNPGTMRAVELGADMASIIGIPVKLELPFTFEASEINKINGMYYYSYSSNPQVNHYATRPDDFPGAVLLGDTMAIGYATSSNPLGPFTLQGAILHNPGKMFSLPYNNNHHKMFEFKGKWYLAYHTKLLMAAMNNYAGTNINLDYNYRATSIDAVNIRPNGKIDLVNGTRNGVPQAGNFDPYQVTDAATMAVMGGISTAEYQSASGPRRMKVTGIDSGDWIALRGVDFGSAGATKFYCRVTPPAGGTNIIQIKIGRLSGVRVGYVVLEPGQPEYTIDLLQPDGMEQPITGIRDLVFVLYGSGWDFEEWQFIP